MPRKLKLARKGHARESEQKKKYALRSKFGKKNKQETRKGHTQESEQKKKVCPGN